MSFNWRAKTLVGVFNSLQHAFQAIPQKNLVEFALEGMGHRVSVNVMNGQLTINNNVATVADLDAVRLSGEFPAKLYYHQRGYHDLNTITGEVSQGILYAVCGWENSTHRAYWWICGQTGKVLLKIEEV